MTSTKLSQDEQLHSQVELHPSEKHTGDSTRGICFRRYITLSEAWARDNGEEGARQSPSNDADPPSVWSWLLHSSRGAAASALLPASRPEDRGNDSHN